MPLLMGPLPRQWLMRQKETIWRRHRRARTGLSRYLTILLLSWRWSWQTLTLEQLRDFVITLFHAPKSSLESPSCAHWAGSLSFIAISHGELDEHDGHWVLDEETHEEGFLDLCKDVFWQYDEDQNFWQRFPFQSRALRKGKG